MRQKTIMLILAALLGLSIISPAPAAEDKNYEGEITVGGVISDINGSEAKANDYTNQNDSFVGKIHLAYDNGRYFFTLGVNQSQEQGLLLEGGLWGGFKYFLTYEEITHNTTSGARTFYLSGVGDSNLGDITPNLNDVRTWKGFDYSTERKIYGAGFRLDLLKPFFINVSASRDDKSGVKPAGVNGFFSESAEIPEPIEYRTDSFTVEAGYAKKPFFASLSYFYSSFDNDSHLLNFDNVYTGSPDSLTLPPDNDYYKVSFKASLFLPLQSRLSMNLGTARTRSGPTRLIEQFTSLPTSQSFNGRTETTDYAFSFTTNPVSWFDARVFASYYDRDNQSDVIDDGVTNELFDYTKRYEGLELGFKLPMNFYLSGGYKNYRIDYQNRIDVDETNDDIYTVNLRWSGLDFLTARAGYERVNRQMDRAIPDDPDEAEIESFVRRYDVAPMHRDSFKASVDISPLDNLNVSLGYIYKKTDYYDTTLGLQKDQRDEFSVDADYTFGSFAKVFGYFDYEKVRAEQFQRRFSSAADVNPDGPVQNPSNFNWDLTQEEKTYDYGVGTDIYLIPKKLTLKLQYDYVMSNGDADFSYLLDAALPPGYTNGTIDAANWDDYRLSCFRVKAVYEAMKSVTLTAGYAYEKYTYSDVQTDDYQYISPSGFPATYLSGANKDPDYKANVYYLSLTYRF